MAGLDSFLGGLASGIGDFGKSIGWFFGNGVNNIIDLGDGIAHGDWSGKHAKEFTKNYYGTDNVKDAYAKNLGTTLNGVSAVADFIPGVNALTAGPIGNAVQGAIGGVADELKANGSNFDLGNAGVRAASGATAGLATGGLSKGINNSLAKAAETGSKNLLAKAGSNAIVRGALTGSLGGATAGATSTLLQGGDLGQVLGNMVSSGASGALQGGIAGGAMNVASKIGGGIQDKVIEPMWEKQVNSGAKERLKQVLVTGADGNVKFTRLSKEALNDINTVRRAQGMTPLSQQDVTAYKNAINNNLGNRVTEGMSPDEVVEIAYKSLTDPQAEALPGSYQNTVMASPYNEGKYNSSVLGLAQDGGTSLKSIEPREANQISAMRAQKNDLIGQPGSPLAANQVGGVAQTGTTLGDQCPDLAATPLGTRGTIVSQNTNDVNSVFNPYGESKLANQTKAGMAKEGLKRFGDTLEGAQTNITRAAARDLGIESVGKSVDNVRKKTGLTNLETQAEFAGELTGKADSLLDNIQRNALAASEDGKPFKVDVTGIAGDVEPIVNKYIGRDTLGGENAKQAFINNLRSDITDGSSDVLSLSNRLKAEAADLRGKGIIDASPKDKAKAKVYTEIAQRLDDASYSAIPQENVNTMFDVAISEMHQRAKVARNNGNNNISKAYEKAADTLDNEPRTIKAFRGFKKDFVDISKINQLSGRAETGAAFQMGSSFAGGAKRFANTLLQRPVNAALAKAGGAINSVADSGTANKVGSALNGIGVIENPGSDFNTALYNIAGRSIGRNETYGVDKSQTINAPYGAGLNDNAGETGALEGISVNGSGLNSSAGQYSGYDTANPYGYSPLTT